MIAVVKNGRTVYLQPAVKLPLVRFMPTLGPQRTAPFLAKGTPIPSTLHSNKADGCHIQPRIWGTQDEHGKLGRKVGSNFFCHMWSTYIRTFAYMLSLMHVNVCVAHPLHLHTLQTLLQDRTTHREELLTPWSHLQIMAANMLWVIRYVFQPLWPLCVFPLSELCYWFKSSDPELEPGWSFCGLDERGGKAHGKVWNLWR